MIGNFMLRFFVPCVSTFALNMLAKHPQNVSVKTPTTPLGDPFEIGAQVIGQIQRIGFPLRSGVVCHIQMIPHEYAFCTRQSEMEDNNDPTDEELPFSDWPIRGEGIDEPWLDDDLAEIQEALDAFERLPIHIQRQLPAIRQDLKHRKALLEQRIPCQTSQTQRQHANTAAGRAPKAAHTAYVKDVTRAKRQAKRASCAGNPSPGAPNAAEVAA